ncbi:MAG: hypothetical protein K1Y02_23565 [Candidatus Hydrogenedentes bacterium]|nr:hypothetical protein [Candidatus Hydrogenedentota bacterium]
MLLSYIVVLASLAAADTAPAVSPELQARSLAVLHEALKEGKVWVKVHAAESLLWTGHPEGVRDLFLKEAESAGTFYRIGVWRVLAQATSNPDERKAYTEKIAAVLLDPKAEDRAHAAETLGKLGYSTHDPEVVRLAQVETGSTLPLMRWVLANSGDAKDEAALAELLDSTDVDSRGCAAYAFRFFKKLRPETYAKLAAAAAKEPADSSRCVLLLSALYLHAPESERPAIHDKLLAFASRGTTEDKREVCAALGRLPRAQDLPVFVPILDDPDLDARAGAAEAILRVENSTK